jgi:hypothetical protein
MVTSTMAFATTLGQVLSNNPRKVYGTDRVCFDRAVQFVLAFLGWPLGLASWFGLSRWPAKATPASGSSSGSDQVPWLIC